MCRHLLILDGSKAAEHAIPSAVEAARTFGAELHLLHVLETAAPSPQGAVDSVAWRMQRAEAGAYLEAWRARIAEQGIGVTTELREGRAAAQALDVVRTLKIDLVVLAPRGAGASTETGLGDTAQKFVADGGVSFLLVRDLNADTTPRPPPRYRRVLVPLDASRRAECALPVGAAIARAHGATLLLAHVAPVPELPDAMPPTPHDVELHERVVARNRERGAAYLEAVRARVATSDLAVTTRVVVAPCVGRAVCRSIRDEEVDLVVASAHGGGCRGSRPFAAYGSVARDLISEGSAPLWVLQDLPGPFAADRSPAVGAVFSSPPPQAQAIARARA